MMELTCAFILLLASLVTATPYGYGVKGGAGASARAESSASAGAFGGVGEVPIAVPLGAGFSGSFSKSSSSSSSSSSASSSSSSFSYNGVGGVPGYGSNSGTQGNVGCLTGNCLVAGANGIPTPNGASIQGYNSANTAAAAGAGAVTGSGSGSCQGLSCDYNSGKCASGQCNPKTQTGISSTDSDKNKCASGQCGSTVQSGVSPTQYDRNDIHVASGASESNSKPNYSHGSGDLYQGSSLNAETGSNYNKPATYLETPKLGSKCNSANCNPEPLVPGHENLPSSYNVPIHGTHDTNEKKPTCDGVQCENQPKRTHSSTSSDSLSTNYLSPQPSLSPDNSAPKEPSSIGIASSTNCKGSNCFGIPSSHITSGTALPVVPGPSSTSCNTPNCRPNPTVSGSLTKSDVPFGSIGQQNLNDAIIPSDDKFLAYTDGFGGPPGILSPNDFDVVTKPTGKPGQTHLSPPQTVPSLGSTTTGCNSPSCSGYPSSGTNTQSVTFAQKPTGSTGTSSSSITPNYTGSFGGPAGTLKPHEFNSHVTPQQVTNRPNYAHPAESSHNTPPSASNIGTPGCKTPDCNGHSPSAVAASGVSASSGLGSYGTTKPGSGSSGEKLPPYTGGFGGPTGVLKPHEHDIHSTVPTSQSHIPSGSYNTPFGSSNPAGCKAPNCYPSNVGATAASNSQAESFGVTKPTSGPHHLGAALPTYTSGYDKPFGATKPHETSAPASVPSFINNQSPSAPVSHPTYTSGYDKPFGATKPHEISAPASAPSFINSQSPSAPVSHPTYTSGYDKPFGATKPHEISAPVSAPSFINNQSPSAPVSHPTYTSGYDKPFGATKPHEISAPASAPSFINTQSPSSPVSHPTYTTGYDKPFGATKPHEISAPASAPSFINTQSPSAPVSHPTYTSGYDKPFGATKPQEISAPGLAPSFINTQLPSAPVSHPTGCTSSSCASYPNSGANANAQSGSFGHTKPNADLSQSGPQYTGSFGGPSGIFKPNDNLHNIPTGSVETNCKTSNCGNSLTASIGATSGATGQQGPFAIPKPSGSEKPSDEKLPTYTGGFGGASGLLKPNDYTGPGISATNKPVVPTGVSKPTACTPENCNFNLPHGSSSNSHNDASSGVNTAATAVADASAVLYTGGFGGPPGFLIPYDDGKVGATHGHHHGSQTGAPYNPYNAKSQPPHVTNPGVTSGISSNTEPTGHNAAHGNTGAQAGSIANSAAYSGAAAGASTGGSSYGYNTQGSHHNHAGDSKGGSPCGVGCSGASGDGANYDYNSGHGLSKFGHLGGLSGGRSIASAKSIAGSSATGLGGSFASSSASAHASAGAYTKGGYGKR